MNVFTKNAGRILDPNETKEMTSAYRARKIETGLKEDEYVRSEFFGLNHVQHLLNQDGCVGLRIQHAKRWEDADGNPTAAGKGQLKPRVLLTGVDANGKDMPIYADKAGMKDMPQDSGGRSLGVGMPCPQYCSK